MSGTTRARLAWGIAGGSVAMIVVSEVYAFTFTSQFDPVIGFTVLLASLAFGCVGALITSRTGNGVGWALLAVIGTLGLSQLGDSYATYALAPPTHRLPLTSFAAWLDTMGFFPSLLYPTGIPRWRWVWRLYVSATAVMIAGWAILPQTLGLSSDAVTGPANPFAIDAAKPVDQVVVMIAGLAILVCAALSVVSLIARFRASDDDERQQVRWLAYVGVAAVISFVLVIVVNVVFGDDPAPGLPTFVSNATFTVFFWIVLFGIPAACGVAILRYRLYDLDVVIKKAVVALVLTLLIVVPSAVVFAFASTMLTEAEDTRLVLLGGVAIGALLFPALRLARRVANRITYGRRATPYELMTAFGERVSEAYSIDDVLPRLAQLLANGTGATSARVLLRVGPDLREMASDGTPQGDETVVPVIHQGEEVGALAVTFPPNDPIDAEKERLITDLAAQAGLVLRNTRLLEELRASRQRLVAAQDEERRKIERNLHDGVQQQLVAMNVQLGLLARVTEADPAKAIEMATMLQTRSTEALDDLRDLARGIYPPLLADKGLVAALGAQARKAAVPTSVASDGIGRYPQDAESAVYFCALEALNNVAKYAEASEAVIELTQQDGHLRFVVRDDGAGFDTSATAYGTGLQGMADRLDAIGGSLSVTSTPGHGTTITGTIATGATG
jgi:signal transduction histidine kinase